MFDLFTNTVIERKTDKIQLGNCQVIMAIMTLYLVIITEYLLSEANAAVDYALASLGHNQLKHWPWENIVL